MLWRKSGESSSVEQILDNVSHVVRMLCRATRFPRGEISTLYGTGGTQSPGKGSALCFQRGGSQPLVGWDDLRRGLQSRQEELYGSGSWISSLRRRADQAASTKTSIQKRCTPSSHLYPVDSSRLFDNEGRPWCKAVVWLKSQARD
jgi:hypothetical protein